MIDALLTGPQAPPTVLQPTAGTEPDLDLIKQVEQVTRLALEGLPALCRGSERGDHRRGRSPRISDFATTALAVIWLQKQPGEAETCLRRGSPAMLPAHAAVSRTGPHGLPSRCSAKFGETDP
jgi:hypothetical protein